MIGGIKYLVFWKSEQVHKNWPSGPTSLQSEWASCMCNEDVTNSYSYSHNQKVIQAYIWSAGHI